MIELETMPDGKPNLDLGERHLVLGMFTPDNPDAPDNVARVKLLGGYDVRYGLHKGMKWREVPRDWLYGFALNDDRAKGQVSRCILRAAVLEYLDRSRQLVAPERLCKPERKMLELRQRKPR